VTGPRVVAIGGGTGLPRVLTALLAVGAHPTAVVTMADDGGSSGWLRRAYGILPPGDVRNCLVALADPDSELAQVFQYRFAEGEGLAGHALGNLIIAAMTDIDGSFPEAVASAGRMLGARGACLPSTLADVTLHAEDATGNCIKGQAVIARATDIARVTLEPADPPAYPPVLEALRQAEAILIGPGSLYTSLLPNFLVDGVLDAVKASSARVVYLCNVANQRGETLGMDCADHAEALLDHGLAGAVDTVLVHDPERFPAPARMSVPPVECGDAQVRRLAELGVEVVMADLLDPADGRHHDPERLAAVLPRVIV
jgi:uncharacterized cofD-like protein